MTRPPDYTDKYSLSEEEYAPFDPAQEQEQETPATNGNGHTPKKPRSTRYNGHFKNGSKVIDPPPALEFTDAVDILNSEYPPRKWIIQDILPVGLTSLSAKGKIGKSLTLLEMCISLVEPMDSKILYLDLEGDDLLLQERMRDILQGNELARDRLYFTHKSESLSKGLLEQIEESIDLYQDVVMVVIDVYGIVQAKRDTPDVYQSDSKAWSELHNFAHKHGIALVVLHHTNKRQNASDPFDLISGSTGISGSCDSQWILMRERGQTQANLYVSGRAIVSDLTITFDLGNFTGEYKKITEDDRPEMKASELKVWNALSLSDVPLSPKRIAELTELTLANVQQLVRRMKKKSMIYQSTYGLYSCQSVSLDTKPHVEPTESILKTDKRLTELNSCQSSEVKTDKRLTELNSCQSSEESKTALQASSQKTDRLTDNIEDKKVVSLQKTTRKIPKVKIPRCLDWQCATGPKHVEVREFGKGPEFYCKKHRGYINDSGLPL